MWDVINQAIVINSDLVVITWKKNTRQSEQFQNLFEIIVEPVQETTMSDDDIFVSLIWNKNEIDENPGRDVDTFLTARYHTMMT